MPHECPPAFRSDRNPGKIAIVAAGKGGGIIAAGEFLIDPAHLAQMGPRIPRQKEYGVRAKHRDHRRPTRHTEMEAAQFW